MGKNKPYGRSNGTWKAYAASENHFFLQTYAKGLAFRTPPKELEHLLATTGPVGLASYHCNGSRHGHITTYLLATTKQELDAIARQHGKTMDVRAINDKAIITPGQQDLFTTTPAHTISLNESVDQDYNIKTRHLDLGTLNEHYLKSIRHDITTHLKGLRANRRFTTGNNHVVVNRLEPEHRIFTLPPQPRQLIKDGKGVTEKICKLDIGINLSEGCLANLSPQGWYDPAQNCTYCYAYQNGLPFQTTLYDFTQEEFHDLLTQRLHEMGKSSKTTLNIRFGQNVEVNSPKSIRAIPGHVDTLPLVLDYLARSIKEGKDYRSAMPTKTPEYDTERASVMKAANLSLLVSIGNDELEPGITAWGFTTDKRLEEALKHHEAGVRTTLYIATNIVGGHESRNVYARKAVAFAERWHLPYAELDYRVTRKSDAPAITGVSWEAAKQPPGLFHEGGGWKTSKQGYLIAARTHQDYLHEKNLCSVHVPKEQQRCFGCGLAKAPQDI